MLGHNLCKCRLIFIIFSLADSQGNFWCTVFEIFTIPELHCYTNLWNLKIQNNCWIITSTRKKCICFTRNKVCSMYATNHHIYDLLQSCEWWDAGVVVCLDQGADLHMAQLMPLPLTISCSSESRLVLPSWFYLSGAGSPWWSWTKSKRAVKRLYVSKFYDMQNDADSMTLLRIGQNSELVWQVTTDSSHR